MNFDAWNCRYDQILNISSFFHNEKVKLYLFCVNVSLLLCYHDNWLIWVIFIKQTIETDVAMAATTFSIGVSTYLVICNYGNVRRYETKSRLYRVNPDSSLLVVNWRIANLLRKDYENCKENHHIIQPLNDNCGSALLQGKFTFLILQSLSWYSGMKCYKWINCRCVIFNQTMSICPSRDQY